MKTSAVIGSFQQVLSEQKLLRLCNPDDPSSALEAPYIVDGLLMNGAGRQVKEHYTDTGGITDHVFALCPIVGFIFAPRIRDLLSKRLQASIQLLIAESLLFDRSVDNRPRVLGP